MSKESTRVSTACEQCRKRKTRCDGENPCSTCQYYMVTCRFPRPKKTRPVAEQVDHIESLVERIFQENNLMPSSDEDSDGGANDVDPEFGTRRIKFTPMDDPIYSTTLAGESLSPSYQKVLQQRVTPELYQRYRDVSTMLGMMVIDSAGFAMGDLWAKDPAPPVDPSRFILRVRELCSEPKYQELNDSLKIVIPAGEFINLNPKGPTADMFYGTMASVLANDKVFNDTDTDYQEKLQFMQWALVCGIRNAIRQTLQPASEKRLRAIISLFLSMHACWMGIECQVVLSRVALDLCRDLGLHRTSIYLSGTAEQQSYWASLFWISYSINRNVSMRFGYVATMDKREISKFIPTSIQNRLVNGSKHYLELFSIYDTLYECTCSSTAEGASARRLVRHSLVALKELATWWKAVYPKWSPDANPLLIIEEFQDMYQNDEAVISMLFFTLSTYFYIRLYIFRMCAMTPASVQDHLAAMFPVQVAALKESKGVASSELQSRIASLMSPSFSLRRTGIQFLKLCAAYQRSYSRCSAIYFDIMIVSALLTVNVVLCKLKFENVKHDSALVRKLAAATNELGILPNQELVQLMVKKLYNYADIMDACSIPEGSGSVAQHAVKSEGPTPDSVSSFELMNYDVARSIETELGGL